MYICIMYHVPCTCICTCIYIYIHIYIYIYMRIHTQKYSSASWAFEAASAPSKKRAASAPSKKRAASAATTAAVFFFFRTVSQEATRHRFQEDFKVNNSGINKLTNPCYLLLWVLCARGSMNPVSSNCLHMGPTFWWNK